MFSMEDAVQSRPKLASSRTILSIKSGSRKSLDLTFNKNNVASSPSVKHLGMLLVSRFPENSRLGEDVLKMA